LSIGIAGHGSFNNYLYNNFASQSASLRRIEDPVNYISNGSVIYDDTKFLNNQYLSDYFIENASFFRLDNFNIGYNIGRVFKDSFIKVISEYSKCICHHKISRFRSRIGK
jgi:iron complex outermembrane receptor protein